MEFREETLISYELAKVFPAAVPRRCACHLPGPGQGKTHTKPKTFHEPVHTCKARVCTGVARVSSAQRAPSRRGISEQPVEKGRARLRQIQGPGPRGQATGTTEKKNTRSSETSRRRISLSLIFRNVHPLSVLLSSTVLRSPWRGCDPVFAILSTRRTGRVSVNPISNAVFLAAGRTIPVVIGRGCSFAVEAGSTSSDSLYLFAFFRPSRVGSKTVGIRSRASEIAMEVTRRPSTAKRILRTRSAKLELVRIHALRVHDRIDCIPFFKFTSAINLRHRVRGGKLTTDPVRSTIQRRMPR